MTTKTTVAIKDVRVIMSFPHSSGANISVEYFDIKLVDALFVCVFFFFLELRTIYNIEKCAEILIKLCILQFLRRNTHNSWSLSHLSTVLCVEFNVKTNKYNNIKHSFWTMRCTSFRTIGPFSFPVIILNRKKFVVA